jgi:hypothetical protein
MATRWRRGPMRAFGVGLVVLVAASGCGSNELESPTAMKMKALANFYLEYAVAQKGKGPANEAALKKHIRSVPDFILKTNGVDPSGVDALFTSERDQEPFVVAYAGAISRISGDSTQVIAHEKTGKNGKRLVVYASAKVDLVDEARLKELTGAKQ